MKPVASAVIATAPYPAASLRPMARPRRAGPARSIFMITVVDQVRPWLTPSRAFAATTQPQFGAKISSGGIGRATSHPETSTGLRPNRSDSVPAKKLVTALTAPNARMNVSALVNAARWKVRAASSGTTVRSWPRVPPTSALTATSRQNWARLARSPSRTPAPGAGFPGGAGRAGAGPGSAAVTWLRQPAAGSPRPVRRAAGQHCHGRVPGPFQHAGRGRGALAVPAHHHDRPACDGGCLAGERTQFDVAGAGQVPAGVLAR